MHKHSFHQRTKTFTLLIGVIFLCQCPQIYSQDIETYADFHKESSRLSLHEIIEQGDANAKKGKNDEAILLYTVAINRFFNDMSDTEKKECALAHLKAGNIYYAQGSYINAMDVFVKGLKISESCNFHTNIIKLYNNIGNIYWLFQDMEKAAVYYEKGYELCRKHPYFEAEVKILNNLTSTYVYLSNPEKANYYFQKQKQLDITSGPLYELYRHHILLDEGLILSLAGNYKDAVRYIKQSVDFARKHRMGPWFECASYEDLHKTYQKLNNSDSAMYYLHLFYTTARENGFTDKLKEALKTLRTRYEEQNDRENAQLYKNEYVALTESIFNFREFSRIKNLHFLYETEKYNKEIDTLIAQQLIKEQEIRTQRRILTGILISALIISLLLVTVYLQKRKLSQSYKNLFRINTGIVASERYNKNLRIQYEEKLRMRESQIEELQKKTPHSQPYPAETTIPDTSIPGYEEDDSGKSPKYTASNLNENQKTALSEAISQVMENTFEFCESDFSLDKLAMLVNSNRNYVSQIINETYQMNFNGFINKYRIREARNRLTDIEQYGNYTIQTISESVGYKSSTTFINVFKKITGITPSLYQRMVREQKNL